MWSAYFPRYAVGLCCTDGIRLLPHSIAWVPIQCLGQCSTSLSVRRSVSKRMAVRGKRITDICCCYADQSVTVSKLQVGLLGDARRLQKQLDRIAGRADTNTPSGLHYILQGLCIRLREYVIVAHAILR